MILGRAQLIQVVSISGVDSGFITGRAPKQEAPPGLVTLIPGDEPAAADSFKSSFGNDNVQQGLGTINVSGKIIRQSLFRDLGRIKEMAMRD